MDAISRLSSAVARMSFPDHPGPVCIRDGRGRLRRLEQGLADRLRGPDAGGPFAAVAVAVQQATASLRLPIAMGAPAPAPLEQLIIPALRRLEGLPAWAAEAILSPEEPLLELVLAASQQPGSLVAVDRLAGGAMAFQPLPGAVSLVLEAIAAAQAGDSGKTAPDIEERLDQIMLAYRSAAKQRAIDEARRAGRDSTAEHEGIEAGKAVESLSSTELGRALAAAGRLEWPIDRKEADALRNRIARVRTNLSWKRAKPKRGSATGGQIAEARGQAGMSLERRSSENDAGVRWCRNCGVIPAATGEKFCGTCMHRESPERRQDILDGDAKPLLKELSMMGLEAERAKALQRIAQAADMRNREAPSGKA